MITGLAIKCRGWRSVHLNPERKGFLGLAPTTLLQTLVQRKRWVEGDFQIFLSNYCPLVYGRGRIPLKLQISYCRYLLWPLNCWATLYYVAVPSYCLLSGISLFPKVSSISRISALFINIQSLNVFDFSYMYKPDSNFYIFHGHIQLSSYWFLPFAYVFIGKYAYSLGEFYCCGGTIKGWWNHQRMWLYKRLTSYLFAFVDVLLKSMGFTNAGFIITSKVSEEDASWRYNKEVMEFGATSPMFHILSTLALVNLFSFLIGVKLLILDSNTNRFSELAVQLILCGLIILINIPLYQGLFFRKDNGRMPSSVTYQSTTLAILSCTLLANAQEYVY